MTRVTQSQFPRQLVANINATKQYIDKYSNELTTGLAVSMPGDSSNAATISDTQELMRRVEGHEKRISNAQSFLSFQEDNLADLQEVIIRAKELATQGASELVSTDTRSQMSQEVFELREHIVQIANSTYGGRYVYGGTDDDDPPFDAATYTTPATGGSAVRYTFDAEPGTNQTRSVQVSDAISVRVTTPGDQIFSNALFALERLGRALAGYTTTPANSGTPDGGGVAYNLPAEKSLQTQAIAGSIDLLNDAMENDISEERASIAGRERRLDTALSILKIAKTSGTSLLNKIQNADTTESASQLSQAQTALQASYTVSSRVLNMTILDYI